MCIFSRHRVGCWEHVGAWWKPAGADDVPTKPPFPLIAFLWGFYFLEHLGLVWGWTKTGALEFSLKYPHFPPATQISWIQGVDCLEHFGAWWAWVAVAGRQVGRRFLPGCQSQPGHPLAPTTPPSQSPFSQDHQLGRQASAALQCFLLRSCSPRFEGGEGRVKIWLLV